MVFPVLLLGQDAYLKQHLAQAFVFGSAFLNPLLMSKP
jgi:hypothetical protein